MDTSPNPEREISNAALECATPAERAAYLDGACGGDMELRLRIDALIAAHERAGDFLEGNAGNNESGNVNASAAGDEIVINQALNLLAGIYRDQGNLDRADEIIAELEPRWRATMPADHIVFSVLASHRSRLALARGDSEKALVAANQALDLAGKNPFRAGKAG